MSLSCSDRAYSVTLLTLHAVVCVLSAVTSFLVLFSRGPDKICYHFNDEDGSACDFITFSNIGIAAWSLLCLVLHGLCSFWRRLSMCISIGCKVAVLATLFSLVASIILSAGFVKWCQELNQSISIASSLTGCQKVAEEEDMTRNSTEYSTFYYSTQVAQGCNWTASVLCMILIFLYCRCGCCKQTKDLTVDYDQTNEEQTLLKKS